MALFSKAQHKLLGIDISSTAVKLIELSRSESKGQFEYTVDAFASSMLPPGSVDAAWGDALMIIGGIGVGAFLWYNHQVELQTIEAQRREQERQQQEQLAREKQAAQKRLAEQQRRAADARSEIESRRVARASSIADLARARSSGPAVMTFARSTRPASAGAFRKTCTMMNPHGAA